MRKFIVSVVVALVVLCGASFYVYKTNNVSETYENKEIKKVNNNLLSMMLETSAGSGEYQKTSASSWPTEGYVFNESLSKCENGSSLSWDNAKKNVVMIGTNADKCYVYFDKTITLVDYVKAQYTGTQGENNLYLHDSSLTNGARDNSYRYAGPSETTNNFVCFGYDSKDGSCPTDNLYRIIGVFDNRVKLIKWDYSTSAVLGSGKKSYYDYESLISTKKAVSKGFNTQTEIDVYYWNSSKGNWINGEINNKLNKNYLNSLTEEWNNKISTNIWKIGKVDVGYEVAVKTMYTNEILSPSTEVNYEAKVGLMYVSDYGYSAGPDAWDTPFFGLKGNNYGNSKITDINWMYMGLSEWTISSYAEDSNNWAYYVTSYVGVKSERVGLIYFAVRPCFYLNSDVSYISGKGTKTEPYLIN